MKRIESSKAEELRESGGFGPSQKVPSGIGFSIAQSAGRDAKWVLALTFRKTG